MECLIYQDFLQYSYKMSITTIRSFRGEGLMPGGPCIGGDVAWGCSADACAGAALFNEVVLLDRFGNLPGTTHAGRETD